MPPEAKTDKIKSVYLNNMSIPTRQSDSLLQKRRRTDEGIDSSNLSTTVGTPSKHSKHTSFFPSTQEDPHKEEEPISPYMRAKREVARPKKPLSAYIFFSQEYRDKMKMAHPEWSS